MKRIIFSSMLAINRTHRKKYHTILITLMLCLRHIFEFILRTNDTIVFIFCLLNYYVRQLTIKY